jgi:hypothetical protein
MGNRGGKESLGISGRIVVGLETIATVKHCAARYSLPLK